LIEEALAHNQDLAVAAARVEMAAARARIAGAELVPAVDGGFAARRRRQDFIGLPIPGNESGVIATTTSSYGVSINLSWEVDLWGRLRAGAAGAVAGLQAAGADLAAARLSLSGQTAKSWLAISEARAQLELARANLDSLTRSEAVVRRRYQAGLRPALDLRLAAADRASAAATVEARRQQLDALARQLALLLGRYPDAARLEAELASDAEHDGGRDGSADAPGAAANDPGRLLPPLPSAVPAGLPPQMLARRPDLAAAERRLAAAASDERAARRARWPQLRLTGSGGRSSTELSNLLDGDFSIWSLVGSLAAPIFQGGRLAAAVDLAAAGVDAETARFAGLLLTAFGEVEAALTAEPLLDARIAARQEAAHEAERASRLAEERYRAGLVDYLSVLTAQRSAYAADSALLAARRERLELRVDLILALGGGWSELPAQAAEADASGSTDPASTEESPR
jgi:outer membrane protein TolC